MTRRRGGKGKRRGSSTQKERKEGATRTVLFKRKISVTRKRKRPSRTSIQGRKGAILITTRPRKEEGGRALTPQEKGKSYGRRVKGRGITDGSQTSKHLRFGGESRRYRKKRVTRKKGVSPHKKKGGRRRGGEM